ncbi:MAG: hypothetical protein ABI690_11405 [Chloroflexota bacterium]
MRGRDRLFGTVAIWIAVAIMMNNLLDRFLRITADFSGLWPPLNFTYQTLPDGSVLPGNAISNLTENQLNEIVNRVGSQIITQTNDIVARQAGNIPIFVILALALILAATLSTFFIWRHAHVEADAPAQAKRATNAKSKRGSRVEQVVNALDDDEIAELRARLGDADEEDAVPLEALLGSRDESYRR